MIAFNRKYKSGSRWSFWRWTDVVLNGELYLRRLHIFQTPWGALMLHWLTPDPQPDLHDHPVSFLSLLVKGWYREQTPEGHFTRKWFNVKRATDCHRITSTAPKTITLVLCGPVVRSWGFYTADGWIPWRVYEKQFKT